MSDHFKLIPYKKEHILPLMSQRMNASIRDSYVGGLAEVLESYQGPSGSSTTGILHGKTMVCGGVIRIWEGRGCVWTVFNEESRDCFVPVFRGIRKFLAEQMKIYRRLEMAVPVSFEIGHRRAKLLGFKVECHLARKFLPDGEDCVLYALVRD